MNMYSYDSYLLSTPALQKVIIHTAVSKSGKLFKKLGTFTKWGPSAVGISLIPMMPLIDHPVEGVIDAAFDKYLPLPKEWQHNAHVHEHDKYDKEQDPTKKGESGEAPVVAAAPAAPAAVAAEEVKKEQ